MRILYALSFFIVTACSEGNNTDDVELDSELTDIQLEEMIGIPFADALKYGPKDKSKSKSSKSK
mgnify:CR=1 FL=1